MSDKRSESSSSDNVNTVYTCETCNGLQRQVDALKDFLKEKGIVLRELSTFIVNTNQLNPQASGMWPQLTDDNSYTEYPENFKAMQQAEYEWSQDPNIGCLGCGYDLNDCHCTYVDYEDPLEINTAEEESKSFKSQQVEDNYNYYLDDLNYDAARERRGKGLR